jgi:high-affinity nickel-transport protein
LLEALCYNFTKNLLVYNSPWKLYPLGVLFGLGFDTSSEIALLGITSIHAVQGTSIWLIMLFPVLFTAGMCLIDTTDGGLMLTLYTWHDEDDHLDTKEGEESTTSLTSDAERGTARSLVDQEDLEMEPHVSPNSNDISKKSPAYDETADPALDHVQSGEVAPPVLQPRKRQPDPLIFLYYSTILTGLTVIVALVIGIIQLLSLILNVAEPTGKFWDGVAVAGDYYDVIGGSICGLFLVVGIGAIWFYARFKRWVHATREANIARRFRETSQRQEADEEMDLSTGPDAGQFPQIKPKNLEGEADTNVVLYS